MRSVPDCSGTADPDCESRIAEWKRKAKAAANAGKARNLYVVTLHPEVLTRKEFRDANPNYIEGMPCVYVGITIHDPGDRYEQHKTGYKCSKYPRKFGVELALDLIPTHPLRLPSCIFWGVARDHGS